MLDSSGLELESSDVAVEVLDAVEDVIVALRVAEEARDEEENMSEEMCVALASMVRACKSRPFRRIGAADT